jgi:hypothetical protein
MGFLYKRLRDGRPSLKGVQILTFDSAQASLWFFYYEETVQKSNNEEASIFF